MACSGWKVPTIVATGIICFIAGAGLGGLGGAALGDLFKFKYGPESAGSADALGDAPDPMEMGKGGKGKGKGGMGKGGMGKGGMGKGGMGKGGGMMGGGQPNPKNQLVTLVTKLDQLTKKPLSITLTEEKRAKLREQLQGLDKKEQLGEGDAKNRFDAILEIVKEDRATLEAAGYRWPGQGGGFGGGGQGNVPNPFTTEGNAEHLKSLQEQLAKGKGT